MPPERSKNQRNLHPSIRSARLIRHVAHVRMALRQADQPEGFERREAEEGDLSAGSEYALLDLLTAALDLADDSREQTLVAYARTSLIMHLTRSECR